MAGAGPACTGPVRTEPDGTMPSRALTRVLSWSGVPGAVLAMARPLRFEKNRRCKTRPATGAEDPGTPTRRDQRESATLSTARPQERVFSRNRSSTVGETNCETSPPSLATSRTSEAEMKE